jgi:hypothetical protein
MSLDTPQNDQAFALAIAPFLVAGMPARHGLSEDAYIEKCRALWDACETDERCPEKIIIDRLYAETRALREFGNAAYVDPRARATTEKEPRPKEPLYCIAIGALPYWSLVGDDDVPAAIDELPQAASEFGLYIIAVIDVLGFERMYRRLGPQRMKEIYEKLITAAQSCTETRAIGMHRFDGALVPTLFQFDLGFAYFSDTLLLWAPLGETHVSPFLARCTDVFLEALALGIPLRGAVAVGEAILDQQNGVFLGTPLIDAARLEHAQDWIGIALTRSCREVLPWLDSSVVLPYTPPCKPGTKVELHGGLALDWPRRARARQLDIDAALDRMERPESHRRYYDHAGAFAEHSSAHARWNREERLPICIGFMTRTIIRTRLDGAAAPPELFAMLESMISNGEEDAIAACGFRALLDGKPLPQELATLPDGKRRHLEFIQRVLDEGYIDLDEITLAALEQRMGVAPFTVRHEAYFARPATERNQVWQRCIPFLRAIAAGDDVPDLPEIQLEEGRYFLKQALRSVRGEHLPVDLEALISAIVWARITSAPISEINQRRLDVLRSVKPWDAVADFLVAIAVGSDPEDVQLDFLDEGAISTIQVVRKILGWQEAVRRSVPDALKKANPIDVMLLHQIAVRAMLAFQGNEAEALELTTQLTHLDRAGSPHDAVARSLRTLLATRCEPSMPGGIGKDAEWYLRLVNSSTLAQEAGKALLNYAFAVTREALIARRSLTKYELAVFSLLASGSDELEQLIRHFGEVISGKLDPDLPPLDEAYRAAFAHLADVRAQVDALSDMDLANAALACRAGEDRPEYLQYLRETAGDTDMKSQVAAFFLCVAEGRQVPSVPPDLNDDARQMFVTVGIAAVSPQPLQELAEAALYQRWYGDRWEPETEAAISALAVAGEPFAGIARYLTDLAHRDRWPSMPAGVPRQTLSLLASARRHASEFSRRMVGIGRGRPPATTDSEL